MENSTVDNSISYPGRQAMYAICGTVHGGDLYSDGEIISAPEIMVQCDKCSAVGPEEYCARYFVFGYIFEEPTQYG
jgi:hypothetical protein